MRKTVVIKVTAKMADGPDAAARAHGLTRSQYVQEALRLRLWSDEFHALRARLVPKARAMGYYTDEDIFKLERS